MLTRTAAEPRTLAFSLTTTGMAFLLLVGLAVTAVAAPVSFQDHYGNTVTLQQPARHRAYHQLHTQRPTLHGAATGQRGGQPRHRCTRRYLSACGLATSGRPWHAAAARATWHAQALQAGPS